MKKVINDPRNIVREMLEGAVSVSQGQALLENETVVVRSDLPPVGKRAVALISGGGSGHEPAHGGYVGAGMLTAAVAGDVFTSPSTDSVLAAIRAVAGPAGALLIVKNYTGDRLNFGLAAELARSEGTPVDVVMVADDVALRHTVEQDRRRGIAGTIFVHKVAGAAAAMGLPLAEVAHLARKTAEAVGTMGVALSACTVPSVGKPGFELAPQEIELGLGIHGEQGVERVDILPADALVQRMVATIIEDRGLKSGDRVALLVNGLGATPDMELAIVMRAALNELSRRGLRVERAWSGTFLSALDMAGFSLSILPVDDARLAFLDAPTLAPAWGGPGHVNAVSGRREPKTDSMEGQAGAGDVVLNTRLRDAVMVVADRLVAEERFLSDLDGKAGDGDLGSSMARGAEAVRALPAAAWATPAAALAAMANALRRAVAGSSGPFYAVGLLRAARRVEGSASPSAMDWAEAFRSAVEGVSDLGGAQPGDRTMLDALYPASLRFREQIEAGNSLRGAWSAAVDAAREGAAQTAEMMPKAGRASYLGARAIGHRDAGAAAVVCWMEALLPSLHNSGA